LHLIDGFISISFLLLTDRFGNQHYTDHFNSALTAGELGDAELFQRVRKGQQGNADEQLGSIASVVLALGACFSHTFP
jgi:hypothetical protein